MLYEIEYKYAAEKIGLKAFTRAMEQLNPNEVLTVSGFDDYFSKSSQDYLRHRYNGDKAELTVKRRLSSEALAERIEIDIGVEAGQDTLIQKFAEVLGYEFDFTIYKTCVIWYVGNVVLVYYIVYNGDTMDPMAHFVEIEAHKRLSNAEGLSAITLMEDHLRTLFPHAIQPELRLNQSMFERFSCLWPSI